MFYVRAAGIWVEERQGSRRGIRWVKMFEESCRNKQRNILISLLLKWNGKPKSMQGFQPV